MPRLLLCVCLFFLVIPAIAAAEQPIIVQTKTNAKVYDSVAKYKVEMGQIQKGQQLQVVKHNLLWLEIQWGNQVAYIQKSKTQQLQKAEPNLLMKQNKQATFQVVKDQAIYASPDTTQPVLAKIKQGQFYAYVGQQDNWYVVQFNRQTAYVEKTNTVAGEAVGSFFAETLQAVNVTAQPAPSDQVALLPKGTTIEVFPYDEHYYEVAWGTAFAYLPKAAVVLTEQTYPLLVKETSQLAPYFIVTQQQALFSRTDEQKVEVMQLQKNMRYPILATEGDWIVTSVAGRQGYIHRSQTKMDLGVPVIMYHHILKRNDLGAYKNVSTTVTDQQFKLQMQYLHKQGYRTISVAELERFMKGTLMLPANSVVLTFDDGLLSTREYAYPLLKKYRFQAAQYAITYRNTIAPDKQQFDPMKLQSLSFSDMAQMADVFHYEAHTYNLHTYLEEGSKMLLVSEQELVEDLQKNLAQLPGATSFAYPFGKYNEQIIATVKNVGFTNAMSTISGRNQVGGDVFQIKRLGPTQQTTLNDYKKMVTPYE